MWNSVGRFHNFPHWTRRSKIFVVAGVGRETVTPVGLHHGHLLRGSFSAPWTKSSCADAVAMDGALLTRSSEC